RPGRVRRAQPLRARGTDPSVGHEGGWRTARGLAAGGGAQARAAAGAHARAMAAVGRRTDRSRAERLASVVEPTCRADPWSALPLPPGTPSRPWVGSTIGLMRAFNFSAGPATLPESVLRQAAEEMLDFRGAGASIAELSHRGAEFMAVAAQTEADLRALLSVPEDYAVLFLTGGATTLQALLPLNLAAPGQAADYVLTGHWG